MQRIRQGVFEWDADKERLNIKKHRIDFATACLAFDDPKGLLIFDETHSESEDRWYYLGKIPFGIITVRFSLREDRIRIFGAGFWRKGKKIYDSQNY